MYPGGHLLLRISGTGMFYVLTPRSLPFAGKLSRETCYIVKRDLI
jgi:hypothetical protein